MAQKIMLVEDDINLSEIYKARLEAEGFQVIAAADGEVALAMAVKERPDLIISDVMMPKVSGFDMLDILRGTDGIKETKVIMMTALGQAEDKERADKLGADRYLVKSQVTLEDVVKAVHEVLEGTPTPQITPPLIPTNASVTPANSPVQQIPVVDPQSAQGTPSAPSTVPSTTPINPSLGTSSSDEQSAVLSQIQSFVDEQEATSAPAAKSEPTASPASAPQAENNHRQTVIQPPTSETDSSKPEQTDDTKSAVPAPSDPTSIAL